MALEYIRALKGGLAEWAAVLFGSTVTLQVAFQMLWSFVCFVALRAAVQFFRGCLVFSVVHVVNTDGIAGC